MSSWLQPGVCERLQGRGVVLGFIGSLSRTRASADVLNALLDLNVFGQVMLCYYVERVMRGLHLPMPVPP